MDLVKQFGEDISECFCVNEEGQEFLPHTKAQELATARKVSEILQHTLSERWPGFQQFNTSSQVFVGDLTSLIIPHSVKIFLILVMVGKPWLIESFRINDRLLVRDTALPVPTPKSKNKKAILIGDRAVSTDPPWTSADVTVFLYNQWKFTAPVFTTEPFQNNSPLCRMAVLPYVEYEPQDESDYNSKKYVEVDRSGSYGEVKHRVIHKDHLQLSDDQITTRDKNNHHRVATKRFLSNNTNEKKIMNEVENLDRIRQHVKSDFIIKAIAFYEQHRQYHLVFPWAGRGTLQELWMCEEYEATRIKLGEEFVRWVFRQMSGVTEAVAMMHERLIRHGDLKPQNILCFPDTSQPIIPIRLVITDIGTAKEHQDPTKERKRKEKSATTTAVSTVRYEAPELNNHDIDTLSAMAELKKTKKQLSRTFDVWSLGCVWTEFIFWVLYGYKNGYDLFNTHTEGKEFWHNSTGGDDIENVQVNDHVKHWLDQVENHDGRCGTNTALGALVSLIRKRLLIVKVAVLHKPGGPQPSLTPPSTPLSIRLLVSRWHNMSGRKQPASGSGSRPATRDTTDKETAYRATADDAVKELKLIIERLDREESFMAAGEGNPEFSTVPKLRLEAPSPASSPSGPVSSDKPRRPLWSERIKGKKREK